MPIVSVTAMIMMLRVWLRSTLLRIKLSNPTLAMVPKSNNIMPPRTASGMLCKRAFSFPTTENTIAVAAEMRITAGEVTFVMLIAPVTSE